MASEQIEVTAEVLNGLADKIDGLSLDDTEQAVMEAVLARATATKDAEVSGFLVGIFPSRNLKMADIKDTSRKLAKALGVFDEDMVR